MYTNEEMEIRLWDYIDGNGTGAEKLAVQELIASNQVWREQYDQLMLLHEKLLHAETEQPSMRFTKNIMESIAASAIARPAKNYVNKWVVRSIAAFFIVTLLAVVVTSIGALGKDFDFSHGSSAISDFMKNISVTQIFSNGGFLFAITASAVAGLAFLDTYRTRMKRG
jgi:hypothetical protein